MSDGRMDVVCEEATSENNDMSEAIANDSVLGKRKIDGIEQVDNDKSCSNNVHLEDSPEIKRVKVCVVDLSASTATEFESFANSSNLAQETDILSHVLKENLLSDEDSQSLRNLLNKHSSLDEHISRIPIINSLLSETSVGHRSRAASFALVIMPSSPQDAHLQQVKESGQASMLSSSMVSSSVSIPPVDCAICHSEVYLTEPGSYCILPCRHAYHQKCIKPWFQTQLNLSGDIDCPRCRKVIQYSNTNASSSTVANRDLHDRQFDANFFVNPLNRFNNNNNNRDTAADTSQLTSENFTEENFLVENDLLPAPPAAQTEDEIIDDFLVRLRRRNWDRNTKLIVGIAGIFLGLGLSFGGLTGSMLGTAVGYFMHYELGQKVIGRMTGELFGTMLGLLGRYVRRQTWTFVVWRVLVALMGILGHMWVISAFVRWTHFSDEYVMECIAHISIITLLIIGIGYVKNDQMRWWSSLFLQGALTYYMVFHFRTLSFWEDLFIGFAQQIVFVVSQQRTSS